MNNNIKASAILHENCLTDDIIEVLNDGWVYTGHNGANVKITYYTYANEWSDKEHEKYFKSIDNAINWYKKNMLERVKDMGKYWAYDNRDTEEADTLTDDDFIYEWEDIVSCCLIG